MVKILAKLKLYSNRKMPIHTGYRPLFKFIDATMTSGQIALLDRDELFPGEDATVEILFVFKEFLGDDLFPGRKVTFCEGPNILGEIEILNFAEVEEDWNNTQK